MESLLIKLLVFINNNIITFFSEKNKKLYIFDSPIYKGRVFLSPTKRQMKRHLSTVRDSDGFFTSLSKALKNIDGNICLDIGANLGYWSLAFNKYLEREKIIFSFEPEKLKMSNLSHNLKCEENITLLQIGLGSKIEDISLGIPEYTKNRGGEHAQNTGTVSVFNDRDNSPSRFTTVDLLLSSVTHVKEKVFLIKIDVEGFEYEVIKGMEDCVRRDRPLIILEINPTTQLLAGYDLRNILMVFLNYNYKFYIPKPLDLRINDSGIPNISLNMILCPEESVGEIEREMDYKEFKE